jgi:hypothetical protein
MRCVGDVELFRGRLDQKQFEFSELAVAAYFDRSEGRRRGLSEPGR